MKTNVINIPSSVNVLPKFRLFNICLKTLKNVDFWKHSSQFLFFPTRWKRNSEVQIRSRNFKKMHILGDINSLLNEFCPKYSFIHSEWNRVQQMENRAVDGKLHSGWIFLQWMNNSMRIKNGLRTENGQQMKLESNNSSSLALRFQTITTHILSLNDPNEVPFVALCSKKLRFCFKLCIFWIFLLFIFGCLDIPMYACLYSLLYILQQLKLIFYISMYASL